MWFLSHHAIEIGLADADKVMSNLGPRKPDIEQDTMGFISTGSKAMDSLMTNGIPIGRVTEVAGSPGAGKTQLGMQLSVNTVMPEDLGGLNADVIYIDTENSLSALRLKEMMDSWIKENEVINLESQDLVAKIQQITVSDHTELFEFVQDLHDYLERSKNVRLIVLDSIAFHFRQNFTDMTERTRILSKMAQTLRNIAYQKRIAVLITNQMTTKIIKGSETVHWVPALGDSWGHCCTNR